MNKYQHKPVLASLSPMQYLYYIVLIIVYLYCNYENILLEIIKMANLVLTVVPESSSMFKNPSSSCSLAVPKTPTKYTATVFHSTTTATEAPPFSLLPPLEVPSLHRMSEMFRISKMGFLLLSARNVK